MGDTVIALYSDEGNVWHRMFRGEKPPPEVPGVERLYRVRFLDADGVWRTTGSFPEGFAIVHTGPVL